MSNHTCPTCSRQRGQAHAQGCRNRPDKRLYIRWNRSLLRTMPDAPAGYFWGISCEANGKTSAVRQHKFLKDAAKAFKDMCFWQRAEMNIFAECYNLAGDQTVTPFIIGTVRLGYFSRLSP